MDISIEKESLILRGEHDCYAMPLDALAAWGELLGAGSDVETVAAMMTAADPGVLDPETGRNAWTSAYEQVEHDRLNDLNQVRSAALHRSFAANGALLADGRMETRRLLGLPGTATSPYEREARQATAIALDEPTPLTDDGTIPLPATVDATGLSSLLAEHAGELEEARERFFDGITPRTLQR